MNTRHNKGFSLIELMIAVALGTLVVMAVVTLFITNQRTYNLQQNTRIIQQQGLFVLEHMVQDIRKAGYRHISGVNEIGVVLTEVNNISGSKDGAGNSASSNPDRLTVAFDVVVEGASDRNNTTAPRDCEGTKITSTTRVLQTYWLNEEEEELRCKSSYSASDEGLVLLEGVESFQVLYGIDAIKDGLASVSHYVTADKLTEDNVGAVVAIRMGFIVANNSGDGTTSTEKTYYLLDKEIKLGGADKKVRRQFMRTIPLRNFNENKI